MNNVVFKFFFLLKKLYSHKDKILMFCVSLSGKAGLTFLTLMEPAAKRLNHSF